MMPSNSYITLSTPRVLPSLKDLKHIVTIHTDFLENFNTLIYESPKARAQTVKAERSRGYAIGLDIARALNIGTKVIKVEGEDLRFAYRDVAKRYLTEGKVFCFINLLRERSKKDPEKPRYKTDIYNVAVKELIDGITDAGLWEDDNEAIHTDLWIHFEGLDIKNKVEIRFYEI